MATNERLRTALVQREVSVEELARKCNVDPKTAGRWITKARVPHRSNRRTTCDLLGFSEEYLWPDVRDQDPYLHPDGPQSEIVRTYSDRASVPRDVWLRMLANATESLDFLVYSGTFLAQTNPRIAASLADRAAAGVRIRLCFGDADGSAVANRDAEEGIGGTLGAKVRASLSYFRSLVGVDNCEIRLHNTTLYVSLFRYDTDALVNPHIYGRPSSANPVLHLKSTGDDDMFAKYLSGFEEVWEGAKPWQP